MCWALPMSYLTFMRRTSAVKRKTLLAESLRQQQEILQRPLIQYEIRRMLREDGMHCTAWLAVPSLVCATRSRRKEHEPRQRAECGWGVSQATDLALCIQLCIRRPADPAWRHLRSREHLLVVRHSLHVVANDFRR